jgi:hypothetical protein
MTVIDQPRNAAHRTNVQAGNGTAPENTRPARKYAGYVWAITRLSLGWVFL